MTFHACADCCPWLGLLGSVAEEEDKPVVQVKAAAAANLKRYKVEAKSPDAASTLTSAV